MTHMLQIKTKEQLEALCHAARDVFDDAELALRDVLTPDRCHEIRDMRCGNEIYSWRGIAFECHRRWKAKGIDPSSQIWGMALCKVAALAHGEDYRQPPWN